MVYHGVSAVGHGVFDRLVVLSATYGRLLLNGVLAVGNGTVVSQHRATCLTMATLLGFWSPSRWRCRFQGVSSDSRAHVSRRRGERVPFVPYIHPVL